VRRVFGAADDVALRPAARERVGLHRVHLGPRHLLRDRQRDPPGTRAQVHHHRVRHVHRGELVDGPAGHHLGLRAGHEDPGPDLKLGVPEVGEAGDVLERFAGLTAGYLVPEPRVEPGVRHEVQLATAHPVHVRGDHLRVGARGFHAGLGQPGSRDRDLIQQQCHCGPAELAASGRRD
jgi:hypothetical protein